MSEDHDRLKTNHHIVNNKNVSSDTIKSVEANFSGSSGISKTGGEKKTKERSNEDTTSRRIIRVQLNFET